MEALEPRRVLAQLIGIQPNDGSLLEDGDVLHSAPTQLTLRFDETPPALDASQLSGNIRVVRSGFDGVFGNANDVIVRPGFVGLGENANEAIVRFAETLPDDVYRIDVFGESTRFELDLGAKVIAVVPQPITRVNGQLVQARSQIVVYFNNDDLDPTSAEDPRFYQLLFTNDTATNTDNGAVHRPVDVSYDAGADRAVLTFSAPLDELSTGPGTYRLRIGNDESTPLPPLRDDLTNDDAGSSFANATDLGPLLRAQIVAGEIIDFDSYPLDFPGGNDDPGHRDLPIESDNQHIDDTILPDGTRVPTKDEFGGISTVGFVFRDVYGYDPQNRPLRNLITEQQRQRTREIFSLFSEYIGVQFFEVDESTLPDLRNVNFPIISVAHGDMRAVDPDAGDGPGGVAGIAGDVVDPVLGAINTVIVDAAERLDDSYGGAWFETAMGLVTYALGGGYADDLPPGTTGSDQVILGYEPEPMFPGHHDIVHMQHLFRPEGRDIDLYRFELTQAGLFTAETMAERQQDSSLLDTTLNLYREDAAGNRVLIARNDDYFSNDSFIELALEPGTYYVGVSASGNDQYNPVSVDSGIGGRTEGLYDLRLDFRPEVNVSLVDATGTALDGDADGLPGGVHNFWFRAQTPARTLIVDKAAAGGGVGSLLSPYNNLAVAMSAARPGDVVRIVGNGGADQNPATLADNLAFEIGFDQLSRPLQDGSTFEVPQGVTVMVDAGAVFKLRRARIGVGSSTPRVDRSESALQVLGTPSQRVYFTSVNDETIGADTNPLPTTPAAGEWGGLVFRNDVDSTEGRFVYEDEGIFLNYVNHAELLYGGGEVVIESVQQIVTPIQMIQARPTVTNNRITRSADAAMSADPDSFEETNFHAPEYQSVAFTSDYTRVGPEIHGNHLTNNSINGLFVRISTPAGNNVRPMTVSGRWDDTDIVHVLTENLVIRGTMGGPMQGDSRAPDISRVIVQPDDGGSLNSGDYTYRFTYVLADGTETMASDATLPVSVLGRGVQGTIVLDDLPITFQDAVTRRIFRSSTGPEGPFELVAETAMTVDTFVDDGSVRGGEILDLNQLDLRARLDARLAIDPATVVKLEGSHIDVATGGQLIAEGRDGFEVIFTSLRDDRYGAGGTFDTRNDGARTSPSPGNWGGIYAGPSSVLSIDHAYVGFAGGITTVEGNFTGFNALEIHQAHARVTNSTFAQNGVGTGGQAPTDRFGRGFNAPGTIFIRGAQPIIVGNSIRDGLGPAINANPGALSSDLVVDHGRSTGAIDRIAAYGDNQGPLIRDNQLGNNAVNGMVVRGEILTTESVWDDTDIVHVVFDEIIVPNFHSFGGLRLESSATASLIVKFNGEFAGLTASGSPLDQADRIGGRLQVVGQPGFPVVLTSLRDDTIGAGFDPDGRVQTDTDNNGDRLDPGDSLPTGPEVNNGTLIDNDVTVTSPGFFEAQPIAGGQVIDSSVTVQTQNAVLQNQNFFGLFVNYVDVGRNGSAFNLAATNITLPPTLIANDVVASEGNFLVGPADDQQEIRWRVETSFRNGDPTMYNEVSFSSDEPLGNLRLINYFDPAIFGAGGDILLTRGTAGRNDFRAFVLDDAQRIGFGHGGVLQQGEGLQNAVFAGWAADLAADLNGAIVGAGAAYSVAGNIDQVDLVLDDDPDLGRVFGPEDASTAFAFDITSAARSATMTSFVQLIGRDPTSLAGDWRGLLIDEYSNDRNVDVATEREPSDENAPGVNGLPSTAQFLGELAPNLKSGDDNRRLGFEVHGYLNSPSDVDVYSFRGVGGTEVWIDLDRTSSWLDSVVELVDANGVTIARSDDSYREMAGLDSVFGPAQSMDRSTFLGKDLYSTNAYDAGMRLRLPGAAGALSTYHVRVRSYSENLVSDVSGGETHGSYQLQVRLQELDEISGSTVQFADLRNARVGITILGQPANSPLLGDLSEVDGDNQTRATAQPIGNILSSDHGSVTLVGSMTNRDDIDWYEFDVQLEDVSRTNNPFYAAFTIDMDYTAGLGRPNLDIYLFNSEGRLIYSSDDSDVPDDQFAPSGAGALEDLATGSGGAGDPFLGTIQLQEGTYFMAVVSKSHRLDVLSDPTVRGEPLNNLVRIAEDRVTSSGGSEIAQDPTVPLLFTPDYSIVASDGSEIVDGETFIVTNAAGQSVTYEFDNDGRVRGRNVPIPYDSNPVGGLLYLLYGTDDDFIPGDTAAEVASTIATAIATFGPAGVTAQSTAGILGGVSLVGAAGVTSQPAIGEAETSLYVSKPSYVPFNLSDVTMFVSTDSGLDQSRLFTIDPYTGQRENIVGIFNANVEDIAIRPDGNIYGFSVTEQNPEPGNIGNYHLIDPASLATQDLSTNIGDDGIQTFQEDPANPGTVVDTNDGVRFQGITFGPMGDQIRGFAIGNRGFLNPLGVQGPTTNLLYEFNIDSGAAFSIMPPDPPDREDDARLEGGGTQIRERGQLDTTVDPIGLGNTALIPTEATEVNAAGNTIALITDGMQFTVDDGAGVVYTFEFNTGPEVTYRYNPGAGIFVRDGDTFLLDGNAYEFDTGSVIVVDAINASAVTDGQTITITDNQIPSVTRTFEFDDGSGGAIGAGRVAIPFNSGMDQAQLINAIINSINSVGNFNIEASLLPNSNRISLRGESTSVGVRTTATAISVQGLPGGAANLIPVEENATFAEFGQAIAAAVPGAGAEGNRINFSGAVVGSFPQLISRGIFTVNAAADGGVSPGAIGVPFLASDDAAQIAQHIADAMNTGSPLSANAAGTSVIAEDGAFFASVEGDLRIGGTAPGGNFTGLAMVGGTLYGVTGPDAFGDGGGGLYRILGPLTNNAVADYIETSTDLLTAGRDAFGNPTGEPIEFTSLTPGPDSLEDGRFADILFGMDVHGNMYAFDLQGNLQPVFMNSQPFVSTGIPNATGFAFSTLDVNLWHVTSMRRTDDGHGVELAPDGSRLTEPDGGNVSLYFGFEDPGTTPGNWGGLLDPGIRNNYNFPGGAHGSIVTNTFSLRDYNSADRPSLFFNYFLDTEQAEGDAGPPPFMRDSFRVFISSDDGEWQLLATNNSFRGNLLGDDEFDYGPFGVQELFDNQGWRQARVDLSPYGGEDNLRLRFDFNSAGALDLGNPLTGGEELRAVDAERLFDGDSFVVQDFFGFGQTVFEFDFGHTLNAVAGSGLTDGETMTLSDGVNPPVTLEMDLGDGVASGNVPVLFHRAMSAMEVARAIEDATLFAFGKGVESMDLTREQNDTIPQPARSTLTQGHIVATGTIGDNPVLFGTATGRDVDMVQLSLDGGQQIDIDLIPDNRAFNGLFSSRLRVFNADGVELLTTASPSASFTAPGDGTYFVGISGGGNANYDPLIQGSGQVGVIGDYRLEIALSGMESPVGTNVNGARLNIHDLASLSIGEGSNLTLGGTPGSVGEPVFVNVNMSDDQVAFAIREAMARTWGSGDPRGIPGYSDVIRLFGHQVIDPGPLGVSVTGFPLADDILVDDPDFDLDPDLDFPGLDGDLFGAFSASTQFDGSTNADFPGFLRGRDNAFEGVYVDDIVIGFAERGTMYSVAPVGDTFTRIPNADLDPTEIYAGDYQIEFRASSFYGVPTSNPVPTLLLTEAYDPTERLGNSVSLIAPRGADATDGMTFRVGDGTNEVVLEYDDPALRNGVMPGHVAVVVSPLDSAAQVANQIRDAINSPAVQARLDLRAESRDASSRIDLFGNPVVDTGVSTLPREVEESNDSIATASQSLIRPNGVQRYLGFGSIGDNPVVGAGLDVDMIRVDLALGDRLLVDVDSIGAPLDSVLRLFNASGTELALVDDLPAPGEPATREAYLEYTATAAGAYYIGVSGFSNMAYDPTEVGSGVIGNQGDYSIEIVVGTPREAVRVLVNDDRFGDQNAVREQGQLIIHSNQIRNSAEFGIAIDAGPRSTDNNAAHQGPPRLLFEVNEDRLAPGVTVKNNVISYNRAGAILYSGDAQPAGQPEAAVPFGRIVNNTLVGGRPSALPELLANEPLGTGIQVEENVSPTILNNIIANFQVGISVDATSRSTVIGGNLYQSNTANSNAGLGDFAIVLGPNDPLFVDRDGGNFNLAAGSRAIDSSVDTLRDRPAMVSVSQPLGIGLSPILSPEMDVTGQLRVDDPRVDTPSGLGSNVFKDRGAIDRADFLGPVASLIGPRDNDAAGADLNPAVTVVQVNNPAIRSFDIQLNDGVTETGRQAGTGIDHDTVTRDVIQVMRDGATLQEGVDYIFSYDATSRIIRLTPLTGVWQPGRVYVIQLDNSVSGVRDLANNRLQPNQTQGQTTFTVSIGGESQDFGDAPAPYPTVLLNNGASHVIDQGFFLGTSVDAEPDGIPSENADGDSGDENGVTFLTPLVPGRTGTIQVVASEAGVIDAWIDLNRDGDWSDPGEKIFSSRAVSAGVNSLSVAIPVTASKGVSYARFRLSREGGLEPTGLALNGEVEDYRISLVDQTPWHNGARREDVNRDGLVVPRDALLVINELNNRRASDRVTGLLVNPPVSPNDPENLGFVDVDGDGFASPRDALLVINLLNAMANGEGEHDEQLATSVVDVSPQATLPAIPAFAAAIAAVGDGGFEETAPGVFTQTVLENAAGSSQPVDLALSRDVDQIFGDAFAEEGSSVAEEWESIMDEIAETHQDEKDYFVW